MRLDILHKRGSYSALSLLLVIIAEIIYKTQNNTDRIHWLRQNFYDTATIPVKEKINFTQAAFIFKTRVTEDFEIFQDSFEQDKPDFSTTFLDLIDTSVLVLNNDIG